MQAALIDRYGSNDLVKVVDIAVTVDKCSLHRTPWFPSSDERPDQCPETCSRAPRMSPSAGRRHTAAVYLAPAGMPLPQLAQQLGHATIAMTMRYARFHADYTDVGRYFDRVARALGRESAPARVQSRVQAAGPGDAGGARRPTTHGGTTDWKTGPAGIEPATPGFGVIGSPRTPWHDR